MRDGAGAPGPRNALIGRVLLASALLMLALAALFFTGALGTPEHTRVLVAMVLGSAAAVDALAGVYFLSRAS